MKAPAAIVLALAFLLAVGTTVTKSTSQNNFHLTVSSKGDVEARRKALVELGAQIDWRAEFEKVGLNLPEATVAQLLHPLLERSGLESDGPGIFVQINLEISGLRAYYPQFDQIDRAIRVIEARMQLAADFSNLEAILDDPSEVENRRARVWSIFGSGFPEESAAGLRKVREREPDPQLQKFIDLLNDSLEHRLEMRKSATE